MKKASFCLIVALLVFAQACANTGWQQPMKPHTESRTAYRVKGKATADTSVALSDHQLRALSRHLAVIDAEKKLRARLMEERLSDGQTLGEAAEEDLALRARMEALLKGATRVDVRWTSPHRAEVMLELKQTDIDRLLDSYRVMANVSGTS